MVAVTFPSLSNFTYTINFTYHNNIEKEKVILPYTEDLYTKVLLLFDQSVLLIH